MNTYVSGNTFAILIFLQYVQYCCMCNTEVLQSCCIAHTTNLQVSAYTHVYHVLHPVRDPDPDPDPDLDFSAPQWPPVLILGSLSS